MRVSLFVTCLADQFWPEVGHATAKVLKRAGCDVVVNPEQTCCGQPAFNTGYRHEARRVGARFVALFDRDDVDAVIMPSGSCAAMAKHLPELFEEGTSEWEGAHRVARKTHELAAFLVRELKIVNLGARYEGCLTWHDACHGLRDLGLRDEPRQLLAAVEGVQLVEMLPEETCCGFGGTFSVKHPEISIAILDKKLEAVAPAVDAVVSGDVSCLLQIGGRLTRLGARPKVLHLAEVLASGGES